MKFDYKGELENLLDSWMVATEHEGLETYEMGARAVQNFFHKGTEGWDLDMVFTVLDVDPQEQQRLAQNIEILPNEE